MIKKINKMNKKAIFCTLLLITIISNIIPVSKAVRLSGRTNIRGIGISDDLLLYKNRYCLIVFDVYDNENEQYPAYNALYPTYNYNDPYEAELIDEDSFIWQVVVNGYPYKSIGELSCESFAEAYTATQVAIYCAYCDHEESDYSYFEGNEASERTYNAFTKILENARNSAKTVNKNNVLKLIDQQSDWQIDENQENIYKTYKIKTNYDLETYKVELLNFDTAIIVDEKNNEKLEFSKEETFKIILPISELTRTGELEIIITTEVETLPVYLGTSPENTYILTAPPYEEVSKSFSQAYQENLTSINIKVQESDTKIGIENALVNLLDENKELIRILTTNEQGQIFIENLLPGKYYIEQIATEDGYNTYTKLIELNMDYNKVVNLTINNSPVNIQNIVEKKEDIMVQEEIIEKNIDTEVSEKNINNKTDITNENNKHNSYIENNETIEKNQNNTNTDTNINNKTDVTNENNTNNSYTENNETTEQNKNNQNTDTNINNKTDVTNENNTNNSYAENNETTEQNKNNQNTDTNINNKTDVTNENNTTTQNNQNTNNNNTIQNNQSTSTNNNNTNNSYTQNNNVTSNGSNSANSNSYDNNYSQETVKKLPKTGM